MATTYSLSNFSVRNKILLLLFFFAVPLGGLIIYSLNLVQNDLNVSESELRGVKEARETILKTLNKDSSVESFKIFKKVVEIGDEWREFALSAARMIRDREPLATPALADKLRLIADHEQAFFRDLRRAA